MAKRSAPALLVLLVLFMVGCDEATKQAATSMLSSRPPVQIVPRLLDLRYVTNYDMAFSLLARIGITDASRALAAVGLVILSGLAVFWAKRRRAATKLEHVGFALALSGAIGNLTDRLLRGFVVDFIHVAHWPVFNVADALVVVGVALLVVSGLRAPPSKTPTTPRPLAPPSSS